MLRTSLFIITLSAAALLGQSAHAQEAEAESVKLSTNGVDFNKPADVQAFHARLIKAAHRVCDIPGDSLTIRMDNAECRDRAVRDAVHALAQPALTLVYQDGKSIEPTQVADAEPARRW